MYDTVATALDALNDHLVFERVASHVLLDQHPNLRWTGGRRDRGRDAIEVDGLFGDEQCVAQFSIRRDWKVKLRGELGRYNSDDTLPARYLFVTPQQTYEEDCHALVEEARESYGVELAILGRGWLELRLEGPHRLVAEEILRVRPRLPDRFLTRTRYRGIVRIPGFDAPLVAVAPEVDRVRRVLAAGGIRCVVLVGPGGLGKSRWAFDSIPDGMQTYVLSPASDLDRAAVGDLPAGIDAVVIVDDAHRVKDLRGVRHLLDDDRWSGYRVVMTVRPGYETAVRSAARLEHDEVETVRVDRLRRTHIDELLRNSPHRIRRKDVRLAIQQLSDGIPLIAHLAAEGVSGGRLNRIGVADLLRQHVCDRLDATTADLGRQVLAAVGAVGTLTRDQLDALAEHFEQRRRDVRTTAAELADAGLLKDDGVSYSVTPDAIRAVVIADAFLRRGPDGRADYLDILTRSRPARTTVIEGLAEAVVLGDGDGTDVLRQMVREGFPEEGNRSAQAWDDALREVPAYAAGLPSHAADIIRRFATVWPPEPSAGLFTWLEAPRVLESALAAAAAVSIADVGLAATLLIELSELDAPAPPLTRHPAHDRLRRLATEVIPEQPQWTTDRAAVLVRTVQALSRGPVRYARADSMVQLLMALMSPEFSYTRPTADQESAITWGRLLAPDTPGHREVVCDAAETVAALVPRLDKPALLDLVDAVQDLRRTLRRVRVDVSHGGRVRRLQRSVDAAARTVTRALLKQWDLLPVEVRFRLAVTQARSSLIRGRTVADIDVERLLTLYGDDRPKDWRAEERRARAAGRRLAHQLGAEGGVAWAIRVLPQMSRLPASEDDGESAFFEELGTLHQPSEVVRAARALSASASTARGIPALLRGSVRAGGADVGAAVRDLAGDARIAPYLPGVLDEVPAGTELEVVGVLMRHRDDDTAVQLARHLDRCTRIDARLRGRLLLEIVCPLQGASLARALTHCIAHLDTLDFVAFLGHVRRLVEHDENLPGGSAEAVLRAVARRDPRALIGVVEDRLRTVVGGGLASAPAELRRVDRDAVPRDVHAALADLDEGGRAIAIEHTAALVKQFEVGPATWRVEHELWDLLRAIGPDDDAYAALLLSWADQDPQEIDWAIRGLEGLGKVRCFLPIAHHLAGLGLTAAQQDRLLEAGDPTLHGIVDIGAAQAMAETIRTWLDDSNPNVRAFARRGVEYLESRIRHTKEWLGS